MAWQDDIAQKRQQQQQEQAAKRLHSESVDAVKTNGKEVVASTNPLAKSTDIDSLIQQVKEVQLAALLGNEQKPQTIIINQNDLIKKMDDVSDQLQTSIQSLNNSKHDAQEITELKSLYLALTQLKTAITSSNGDLKEVVTKLITELTQTVHALEIKPVVNVPVPQVTVDIPEVDLKPLQDTLEGYFKAPEIEHGIDLECYRAQDISESGDMQYVGFVNPDGSWYIIENDMKANSIRYVFGNKGYAKAFKKASSYQYFLLNEAIDALST